MRTWMIILLASACWPTWSPAQLAANDYKQRAERENPTQTCAIRVHDLGNEAVEVSGCTPGRMLYACDDGLPPPSVNGARRGPQHSRPPSCRAVPGP